MQVLTSGSPYAKFLSSAQEKRAAVPAEKTMESEYARLMDVFNHTLEEVAGQDGTPRDANSDPVNVLVRDKDKGEVLTLDDEEHQTVLSAYHANGSSHAAPGTLTVFQVDKSANSLWVYEFGDVSAEVNAVMRENLVPVTFTQIRMDQGVACSQSQLSETDAGRFMEGRDSLKQVRRGLGQAY